MLRTRSLLTALLLFAPAWLVAQSGTEIIRGRVLDQNKQPIAGVEVLVVGLTSQSTLTAHTDSRGSFTALFPSADGEYILRARRIGFNPVATRLSRTGISAVIATDIVMVAINVTLDTVTVTAGRVPPRGTDRPSIGGIEQNLLGTALFLTDPSDLFGFAATMPGLLMTAGDSSRFSAMGAAANQNSVVVDGMKFGGGGLPQDAIGAATLITSSFDPAKGQFSGAQISIKTKAGTDVWQSTVRSQTIDRWTTWKDPSSPKPAPRVQAASGGISGPFRKGKTHYLLSADLSLRDEDLFSLQNGTAVLLAPYGLALDTLAAVRDALNALAVPLGDNSIPNDKETDKQTFFGRFDWTPSSTVSLTLSSSGNWSQGRGNSISQLTFPTIGNRSSTSNVGFKLAFSGYFGGFLNELNAAFSTNHSNSAPYLNMAGGSVRVGVLLDGTRQGLNSLRFGGNSSGARTGRQQTFEMTNELSWLSPDSKHRLKFGQSIEGDWDSETRSSNLQGSYTYQTLADLVANRPASYNRTLTKATLDQRGYIPALWLGDEWLPSGAVQFQGGVRLDILNATSQPAYNPAIASLYGLRTDRIPKQVGFSPRLGFSWASAARRGKSSGPSFNGSSSDRDVLSFTREGALQGIAVSGGVGAFRGVLDPEDLAALVDATGLPSTSRYLTCSGAATPIPVWGSADGGIAETCSDGAGGQYRTEARPNVMVYDPAFKVPVRWTGNLGVDGIKFHGVAIGVTGSYSLNQHRESNIDLNLQRAAQFTLTSEGSRPVYVSPTLIVPQSGVIPTAAARPNSDFGSVTRIVSDLRNTARQLNVSLTPVQTLFGRVPWNLQYAWQSQTSTERGFSGTTAGDPFLITSVRGKQPTHQVTLTVSPKVWWFSFALRTSVQSGTPYTPTVVGDNNGDGSSSNDRAFVFNPATLNDVTLAAEMRELIEKAPSGARSCLQRQLGRIAGHNSCMTGWQVRADVALNFTPPSTFGLGDRLRFTTTLQNSTGALVRVFGLDNTPFGRAASSTTPESKLLYVTGFDPASGAFRYRVNQLFGESQDFGASRRRFAPFQVQLGFEYKMGGPPRSPVARSLGLLPTDKSTPLTEEIARSSLRRLGTNPLETILADSADLALTPVQITQLLTASSTFETTRDSLLAPIIGYVLERGHKLADAELTPKLGKPQAGIRQAAVHAAKEATGILTPEQMRRYPAIFPEARKAANGGNN